MVWHWGSGERTTRLHSAANCLGLRKWAQVKYYLRLKVSQILLHQAQAAKQPNPGSQLATQTLRDSPGSHFRGPTLPSPCFLGRKRVLPHGDLHFRGHPWQWDRRTQTPAHTDWPRAGCYCWYPPARLLEHLQPMTSLQQECRWQISYFLLEMKFNLTQIIVFVFPTGSNQA